MAITPKCDRCDKELNEFGAILLGPPDDENRAIKYHLCKKCYHDIIASSKISKPPTKSL